MMVVGAFLLGFVDSFTVLILRLSRNCSPHLLSLG